VRHLRDYTPPHLAYDDAMPSVMIFGKDT